MNKYEQLVEFIINDETDKARELFHNIVVEKSRDIYESIIDDEELDEVGGNQVKGLVDEISLDEEGISEDDEFSDDFDSEEDTNDFGQEEEFGGEEHEEEGLEDRVLDLEDALNELKAEFDSLMADEAGEEEHQDGLNDPEFGDEGSDDFGSEEYGAADDMDDTIVREYVEKVAAPTNSEGSAVGTGKSVAVNKRSTVASKNDFGGSAKNIATGKADASPDGNSPDRSIKPQSKLKGAGSYENVPGAKAGNAFAKKESGKAGEGQTTDGKVPVSNKSLVGGKIR